MKNAFEYEVELAALREELATVKQSEYELKIQLYSRTQNLAAHKLSLTAAEQRNAELVELLKRVDMTPLDSWYSSGLNVAVFAEIQPTESVAYQSLEIGESDWADCTKAEYDRCGKDPHMDTRIKPTESGASE